MKGKTFFVGLLVFVYDGFNPLTCCITAHQYQYSEKWVIPFYLWIAIPDQPGLLHFRGRPFPIIKMNSDAKAKGKEEMEWATIGRIFPIWYNRENTPQADKAVRFLHPPRHDDQAKIKCHPLCGVDVKLQGIPPLFDFRIVVFSEEVPQPIMKGMKTHMKQKQCCPKGPLWFLCNGIAKPVGNSHAVTMNNSPYIVLFPLLKELTSILEGNCPVDRLSHYNT